MALATRTGPVCLVPAGHTEAESCPFADVVLALGLQLIGIPLTPPPVETAMAWHPRHRVDGGHRWPRSAVRRALRPPPS